MVHYVKENNVLLGSKEIQDIIIIIVNSDRNINVSILEIVRGVKGGCQILWLALNTTFRENNGLWTSGLASPETYQSSAERDQVKGY